MNYINYIGGLWQTVNPFAMNSVETYPAFSLEHWRKEVSTNLSNSELSAIEIIKTLSKNPQLLKCYAKPAGVVEGYTVGQHTEMVLELVQRYREYFKPLVCEHVEWGDFLLFLALHDIGKGISKEAVWIDSHPSLSAKELELLTSRKILVETLEQLWVGSHVGHIFQALLMYDSQGDYLKGDLDADCFVKHLLDMSAVSDLTPCQFYQLYNIFHLVDAASYPNLHPLFIFGSESLRHCEGNQSTINYLLNLLRSDIHEITENIPGPIQTVVSIVEVKASIRDLTDEQLKLIIECDPFPSEEYQPLTASELRSYFHKGGQLEILNDGNKYQWDRGKPKLNNLPEEMRPSYIELSKANKYYMVGCTFGQNRSQCLAALMSRAGYSLGDVIAGGDSMINPEAIDMWVEPLLPLQEDLNFANAFGSERLSRWGQVPIGSSASFTNEQEYLDYSNERVDWYNKQLSIMQPTHFLVFAASFRSIIKRLAQSERDLAEFKVTLITWDDTVPKLDPKNYASEEYNKLMTDSYVKLGIQLLEYIKLEGGEELKRELLGKVGVS